MRSKVRRKDGKQHRYWSIVENTRVAGGRVVQRHVLYLGEKFAALQMIDVHLPPTDGRELLLTRSPSLNPNSNCS